MTLVLGSGGIDFLNVGINQTVKSSWDIMIWLAAGNVRGVRVIKAKNSESDGLAA